MRAAVKITFLQKDFIGLYRLLTEFLKIEFDHDGLNIRTGGIGILFLPVMHL
jgi:hypothetical protein